MYYGQFGFYGIYLPTLLGMMVLAYGFKSALCFALGRLNVYRWVWHPALFNLALYVVLLGALFQLFKWVQA